MSMRISAADFFTRVRKNSISKLHYSQDPKKEVRRVGSNNTPVEGHYEQKLVSDTEWPDEVAGASGPSLKSVWVPDRPANLIPGS